MKFEEIDFHLNEGVYPPSEDTYLLLDAVYPNVSGSVLEMGIGSGYLTVFLARKAEMIVACDISLQAVRNARENLIRNVPKQNFAVIQTNLFSATSEDASFDMIVFNPPYLPSDELGTEEDELYIGGEKGTELTEQFLKQAVKRLKPNGSIFVVVSSLSDTERVENVAKALSLDTKVVAKKSLFFETLFVLVANHQ